MPTNAQLRGLYRLSYWITYIALQPIYLVCIDDQTSNLYVLGGNAEDLEFQITPDGEVF